MKYTILLFLLALLLSNNAISSAQLSQYKIVPINKKEPNGTKVLAGIANIRFKPKAKINSFSKIAQNIPQMLNIYNQDFAIIDCYISNSNKVSKQTARFEEYSKQQQQAILECEEILSRTFIVQFSPDIDIKIFCRDILQKYSDIELAEPYYVAQFQGVPNDSAVNSQTLLSTIKAFEA